MVKKIKLPIVCLLVFCLMCMLPLAAAADSGIQTFAYEENNVVYHMENGDVYSQDHYEGTSYWRVWNNFSHQEFVGPSRTVNKGLVIFNKLGIYFGPDCGRPTIVDSGSIVSIKIKSWFLYQLQELGGYSGGYWTKEDYKLTFNARIFDSSSLFPCHVDENSFLSGQGEYVSLDPDSVMWDGDTVTFDFIAPGNLDAYYVTFQLPDKYYSYLNGLFWMEEKWQNYDTVCPSFSIYHNGFTVEAQKERDAINNANKVLGSAQDDQAKIDGFKDQYANTGDVQVDATLTNWDGILSPSKFTFMKNLLQKSWDGLGGHLNFVLGFSLVIGLAIFILGKKAKS